MLEKYLTVAHLVFFCVCDILFASCFPSFDFRALLAKTKMVESNFSDESNRDRRETLVSNERADLSPKQKRTYVKMLSKIIRCDEQKKKCFKSLFQNSNIVSLWLRIFYFIF